jgi:hypothetical protein
MLHRGDEDLIPRAEVRPPPSLSDKVDALGRATNKDDLSLVSRPNKALHRASSALVGRRRANAQLMHSAMNVGVITCVDLMQRVQDRLRLLSARRVIQIRQRFAVNLLVERRKIGSQTVDIIAQSNSPIQAASTANLSATSSVQSTRSAAIGKRSI